MGKFTARFEIFWGLYPSRNGKKLGKFQSFKLFQLLNDEDQLACCRAAGAYAEQYKRKSDPRVFIPEPRDPIRFLRGDWWRDWLLPNQRPCQFRSLAHPCDDSAEPGDTHCKAHRDFIDKLAAKRKAMGYE